MQGLKDFKPKLFYSVQIDTFIPKDHELRSILTCIDFSFVRSKVKDKYFNILQKIMDIPPTDLNALTGELTAPTKCFKPLLRVASLKNVTVG